MKGHKTNFISNTEQVSRVFNLAEELELRKRQWKPHCATEIHKSPIFSNSSKSNVRTSSSHDAMDRLHDLFLFALKIILN